MLGKYVTYAPISPRCKQAEEKEKVKEWQTLTSIKKKLKCKEGRHAEV